MFTIATAVAISSIRLQLSRRRRRHPTFPLSSSGLIIVQVCLFEHFNGFYGIVLLTHQYIEQLLLINLHYTLLGLTFRLVLIKISLINCVISAKIKCVVILVCIAGLNINLVKSQLITNVQILFDFFLLADHAYSLGIPHPHRSGFEHFSFCHFILKAPRQIKLTLVTWILCSLEVYSDAWASNSLVFQVLSFVYFIYFLLLKALDFLHLIVFHRLHPWIFTIVNTFLLLLFLINFRYFNLFLYNFNFRSFTLILLPHIITIIITITIVITNAITYN